MPCAADRGLTVDLAVRTYHPVSSTPGSPTRQ
jgi:hypothetical protein